MAQPIVVVTTLKQLRRVIDLSPAAAKGGVRIGLSLAEARALCNGLVVIEHDPAADTKALEALGRWMTRFTPVVATGWDQACEEKRRVSDQGDALPCPPVLFLDLTGCDRLAGGIQGIIQAVGDALRRFGIPAFLALAPTPGAAWAMASLPAMERTRGFVRIRSVSGDESAVSAALAPLPVASLRLSDNTLAILHHLGLRTIGQLFDIPREELSDRLGPVLMVRLDQALGRRPELLVPLAYEPPIQTKVDFDGPIESLEAVWFVLRKLLDRIVVDLHHRGRGARQVDLICKPSYSAWTGCQLIRKSIRLSRPSRDPVQIFNLLRCASEHLETGEGFWAMKLAVSVHEPVSAEQIALLEGESYAGQIELDRLVERLCIRIGDSAIVRPTIDESYVPERGWTASPYHEAAARASSAPTSKATYLTKPRGSSTGGKSVVQGNRSLKSLLDRPPVQSPRTRPLHLLPRPVEIQVLAEPSDDFEGHPRQFTYQRTVHHLVHAVGPERIGGEWWRGDFTTRNYYDVENTAGERFWIFRLVSQVRVDEQTVKMSSRWFLHGRFD